MSAEPDTQDRRPPPWTWDEILLACDLLASNGWRSLTADDERVLDLSQVLQLLPIYPDLVRGTRFRNPNGVARKTVDLATRHPDYPGKPTKGGRVDRDVLEAFLAHPDEMRAEAKAIRSTLQSGAAGRLPDLIGAEDPGIPEGRLLVRLHVARERNRALRQRKIKSALTMHGRLQCESCGFDFARTYGARGAGYADCHHVVPLHSTGTTTTGLRDLAILCSNCHRMIHLGVPWVTPAELREIISAVAGERQNDHLR